MPISAMDDQPISSTFFTEGRWLSSWVTPNDLEVQRLYEQITKGVNNLEDRIIACWDWVANQVKYKTFIHARLWVEGQLSDQPDYWQNPSLCIHTKIGNCTNKSFLLTSLLRNELPPTQVYCVLGNLYNGKAGGHAWVKVIFNGDSYIIESTRPDVQPMVKESVATRYEAVHLFNDQEMLYIEGKTALEPFTRCASIWLTEYLDYAYMEGRKK